MKSTKKFLAGAAVLSLALSACGNGGTTPAPGGTTGGNQGAEFAADYNKQPLSNIQQGGELNLSIGEITTQMNVHHMDMTSDTRNLWEWYNPTPIWFEANGDVVYDPNYLTKVSAETKDGKTVVTYDINEKATYNDGTPIDYTSFVNTWQVNRGDEGFDANSTDGYVQIESVERGTSDKQAVVTFQGTYAWYDGLFNSFMHPAANTAELYANAYLNPQGGNMESAHPEWGAGPYKLTTFDENGGLIILEPNELWWGENKAKLDKVIIQQRESLAALNAFKNGEVDSVGASSAENLSQVSTMSGISIRRGATPAIFMITLNSGSTILEDVNVREAIANGVNREQIASVQFNGLDYTEEAPGSFILYPYQTGYEDNFGKVAKFDLENSKKLLEDAGWKAGADGIREKDGQKLTLNLPIFGDAQLTKNRAQALQAQMKEIGVDINVVPKASAEFSSVMNARDFDLTISGFRSSDPFGVAYFCQIFCSDSNLNKSGTGTEAIDAKIRELEALDTADEQTKRANEVETEALKSFGLIPLFSGVTIVATSENLANAGAGVFATNSQNVVSAKEYIGFQK